MRSIRSADCVCNQATPHPADPIKCHRARRERRHPKAAHNRSGSEWPPLDSLENKIGGEADQRLKWSKWPSLALSGHAAKHRLIGAACPTAPYCETIALSRTAERGIPCHHTGKSSCRQISKCRFVLRVMDFTCECSLSTIS